MLPFIDQARILHKFWHRNIPHVFRWFSMTFPAINLQRFRDCPFPCAMKRGYKLWIAWFLIFPVWFFLDPDDPQVPFWSLSDWWLKSARWSATVPVLRLPLSTSSGAPGPVRVCRVGLHRAHLFREQRRRWKPNSRGCLRGATATATGGTVSNGGHGGKINYRVIVKTK